MVVLNHRILAEIDEIKSRYHDSRFCLLPALYVFQKEYGWLSPEALAAVGEILNIPKATVKGASTFYAMFSHRPTGSITRKEVPLESYARFQKPGGAVEEKLLRRILHGLSCGNYRECSDAIPEAFSLSSSTVSR